MDKAFLDIYEDELAFLRDMGREFAESHPKIAGRLKLDDVDVRDPYVERLLEGFAFLTARVRLRMQSQYPEFTQNLLSLLYPNFTSPIPSCTVFEFSPKTSESALTTGFTLKRGTVVTGKVEGEDTPCEFALARKTTLRPLVIDRADYTERPPYLERWFPEGSRATPVEAAIRIRFRVEGGATLGALELSDLNMFVAGESGRADRILQAMLMDAVGVVTQPVVDSSDAVNRGPVFLLAPFHHDGFNEDETLLPVSAKTFSGHRLLQEAFIMPEAFRFVTASGFSESFGGRGERAFDLIVGLSSKTPDFADWIDVDTFRLHCAPAVNLFERRTDRIAVKPTQPEHLVIVDRTRPQDFEVFSVNKVDGIARQKRDNDTTQTRTHFQSVFQPQQTGLENTGYFNVRREMKLISSKSKTAYAGTDVHLRLTEPGGGPIGMDMDQLVVTTLCTNRGLPQRLGNKSRYTLRATAPVTKVRAIIGPTPPRLPLSQGSTGWDLINALSINHLSFDSADSTNVAWLNRTLGLFIDDSNVVQRQIVSAFTGMSTRVINRRLPGDGPVSYGRGLEVTLLADIDRLRGTGPFVITSVLERYLRRAATLNAFTQTVLANTDNEESARWPVRMGGRHVL